MSRTRFRVNPHRLPTKWLWVRTKFVYELSGSGFESRCSHRRILVNLKYAKGFACRKYQPKCFGSGSSRELQLMSNSFVKHEGGNIYFNEKAVKPAVICGLESFSNLYLIIKDQMQGPSLDIESTVIHLGVPKKASVNDAIKGLHDCDLFI